MTNMLKNVIIVDGSGWIPFWGDIVIEDGKMTKDLALITTLENVEVLSSLDFIKAVRATLETM